jgi:hypothetical protein
MYILKASREESNGMLEFVMGSLAETAIVDYCLPFAEQGKQANVFRFRLQKTNRSLPFPFFHLQQTNEKR